MTVQYPICKTVRYKEDTFKRVEAAASLLNLTTTEYIRELVQNHTKKIDLKQVLGEHHE